MMKKQIKLTAHLKSLKFCKWILSVVIVFSFLNSFGVELKKQGPTFNKKVSNQKTSFIKPSVGKKSSPTKSKAITSNRTNTKLEKIEIQHDSSPTPELKVVPRPKINPGQLAIFKNGEYILITTKKVDALEVSTNCFEAKTSCTALEIGQTKVTSLQSPSGHVSNPASTLCDQLLGKNFIAIDSKGSEFDYCGFNDGSFVDTWTLLTKVMQK